ncbi:hypothetical protein GCM10023063_19230 [Arthrobacter methylotrophus]|uniref:DUF4304 domain-containing protein n=1 Tax=Arthrobacter methylotrophus TaxID=121291 RepID=A0ABV5UP77_9MICC
MNTHLYRNIPAGQEDLIARLTERYAGQRIRFHTGFVGSVPVQASGRIGRLFFYFRFRGDTASLTLGSADHRSAASRAKHARRKALRKLRRGVAVDWFGGFMLQQDLRRDTALDRHPSRAVWYAVRNDVTGERYAGDLEPEEAAELFIDMMSTLQPAGPEPRWHKLAKLGRGPWTPPMPDHRVVIRKARQ